MQRAGLVIPLVLSLVLLLPAVALGHGGSDFRSPGGSEPPDGVWKTDDAARSAKGTILLEAKLGGDAWLHAKGVWTMVFHPTKPLLVTSGHGSGARLWDLLTGRDAGRIPETDGTRLEFAWSPDGTWMAAGLLDRTIRILDAETLEERHRLGGFTENEYWRGIDSLAIHPEGTYLVACASYDEIRMWETATWKEVRFHEAHSMSIDIVHFAPDGSYYVTAADNGAIAWDTHTGEKRWGAFHHKSFIEDFAFSPDGAHFVTCGMDGTVCVCDARDGSLETRFECGGHRLNVYSVAWSPDGRWIAAGDDDGFLWGFDARWREVAWKRKGHVDDVRVVRFHPSGAYGASVGKHGVIRLWDASNGHWRNHRSGHGACVNALAVTADGKRLVSVSDDQSARVWNLKTGKPEREVRGHGDEVKSVAISPDGAWAVTGAECYDADRSVLRWALAEAAEPVAPTKIGVPTYAVAITPDAKHVVTTGGRFVHCWNAESGETRWTGKGHASFTTCLALAPSGGFVVSGNHDATARVWDVATGRCRHVLAGHDWHVEALAVAPDGTLIATGAGETIRIWDTAAGTLVRKWAFEDGRVDALAYGAGGRRLYAAGSEEVLAFDPTTGTLKDRIAVPGNPECLAVSGTHLWVGCEDGTIVRYALAE